MSVESFRGLFRDGRKVVIPMLQRDYAQGRSDPRSQSILAGFLDSLLGVLRDSELEPLDLDFIYGRVDGKALEPLDGQQRLTTLFLLHWYLAQRDGCQEDFRSWMQQGGHSCFAYRTRPSAEELIDALVGVEVELSKLSDEPDALSNWIADCPWFLRAWRRDPTVSGCLAALDAIHQRFRGLSGGYARLVDTEAPRVRFHLLHLKEFRLSDDLYIKMNARGKPLTLFEVFKAELEQYVEQAFGDEVCPRAEGVTWKQYASGRMDREWTDFLWAHRDEHGEIDERFLQLVRAVAVIHCALQESVDEERLRSQLKTLLEAAEPNLHLYRSEARCLDRRFVERMVALLDVLASCPEGELCFLGRTDYFDEKAALKALLSYQGPREMSFSDWAKLAAYGMFLLARGRAGDLHGDPARTACHEWMRVVCNLVNNADVDRVERLATVMRSLAGMHELGARDGFLAWVASDDAFGRGFNQEQVSEERLKAQLIGQAGSWRPLLEQAEAHAYLQGDLQCLLMFSKVRNRRPGWTWSNEEHAAHQQAFEGWYRRICAVFPADRVGLAELGEPGEFLWQRALLIHGDYLLRSLRNMCLLFDRDRDASWKRLLRADTKLDDRDKRRAVVQRVLEKIDPEKPVESLRAIVAGGPVEGTRLWQRLLVTDTRFIARCERKMLRFQDDTIYLLESRQLNGYYVDLYVFALYLEVHDRLKQRTLKGWTTPEHPRLRGGGKRCTLKLKRSRGGATLWVTTEAQQQVFRTKVADRWEDPLRQAGWAQDGNKWIRRVPLEDGKDTLTEFLAIFARQSAPQDE